MALINTEFYSLQLANPDSVEGLVLINIDINARGWIDWAAQKVYSFFLSEWSGRDPLEGIPTYLEVPL